MSTGDPTVDEQLRRLAHIAPSFTDEQFAYVAGLMKRHAVSPASLPTSSDNALELMRPASTPRADRKFGQEAA